MQKYTYILNKISQLLLRSTKEYSNIETKIMFYVFISIFVPLISGQTEVRM